jgi:hypothetical protein
MILYAEPQGPWWASPLLDGGKVILGAVIGFFATQVKDWRDRKRTETAFLSAVHEELLTIRKQLAKSEMELDGSVERLRQGIPLRLVMRLSTRVFDSQLSSLKDLTNPLILRIVDFYSTLALTDDLTVAINTISDQLVNADGPQTRLLNNRLQSTVMVTQEEVHRYRTNLRKLLDSFPKEFKRPEELTE